MGLKAKLRKAENTDRPGERWLALPKREHYEVSDHGRIRRAWAGAGYPEGYFLKLWPNPCGYAHVMVYGGPNGRQLMGMHILVMLTHKGPPPPGKQVNHLDGNKQNNHLWNLDYVTPSENMRHAIATGLRGGKTPAPKRTKLTDRKVRAIRRRCAAGQSQQSVARDFGVSVSTVGAVVRRERWQHVT